MRVILPEKKSARRSPRRRLVLAFACLLLLLLIPVLRFFRSLTGAMAVSNASDLITRTVSDIVEGKMRSPEWQEGAFVSFEKDETGAITAIFTDTARVNILSADLLSAVVAASAAGDLDLRIPLGDLLGMSLFLGRGPRIPVRITLLTSSRVEVSNVLTDAGINQTRHQLLLTVLVDADVLLPWEIRSARIVTPVLISETVIVGSVPQTYVTSQ